MTTNYYTKFLDRDISKVVTTKHAVDQAHDRCRLPWKTLVNLVIKAIEGHQYAVKSCGIYITIPNGTAVCTLGYDCIVIVTVLCIDWVTQDERGGDKLTHKPFVNLPRMRCPSDHLEMGVHGKMFCAQEECPRAGEDDYV